MQSYILPDGTTIQLHDATAHRFAPVVSFTMKGGAIMPAIRADLWQAAGLPTPKEVQTT